MRHPLALCALAAALVAAAPAFAQRASLADRVTVLEQQAANNQGNVDLLNQVQQLRSEVTALRSQLEEVQQQNAQLKADLDARWGDLDGRVARLETGGVATTVPVAPASASTSRGAAVVAERPPTVRGDAGKVALSADERTAYNAAFDVLKAGDYVGSAQRFQQFLRDYPAGTYAPNALYWLGESYYVTQNYELAQEQFQALLTQYPTHDKAPGALLKVGLAQYGLKQMDAAEATLARVAQQYPGTDAARTAEDRLRAIQLNRVR
ncbi:Tol-pal system protein YbgF [Lysobacter dokdonensis DS-58]|uniref:Cell division coordinator CpoB n=1 Tax=Lysobacter dokdonensis DS-58 TaxID=1300345 RepID=A0A0A2WJB0_9GAMM|nr:tol-pal system protein YbgF [Lysobacter dokdonensis]KGQ18807.1 Tol-pal system protein YbgF [Lysobacter dokdonensis DS-58]